MPITRPFLPSSRRRLASNGTGLTVSWSVASGGSSGSAPGAARRACAGRSSAPRRSGSHTPRPGCQRSRCADRRRDWPHGRARCRARRRVSQTRSRISAERSPIPAVNTRPSRPPSTAASAPSSRQIRQTNRSIAWRGARVVARQSVAHVVADPGHALEPALVVEHALDRVGVHAVARGSGGARRPDRARRSGCPWAGRRAR